MARPACAIALLSRSSSLLPRSPKFAQVRPVLGAHQHSLLEYSRV